LCFGVGGVTEERGRSGVAVMAGASGWAVVDWGGAELWVCHRRSWGGGQCVTCGVGGVRPLSGVRSLVGGSSDGAGAARLTRPVVVYRGVPVLVRGRLARSWGEQASRGRGGGWGAQGACRSQLLWPAARWLRRRWDGRTAVCSRATGLGGGCFRVMGRLAGGGAVRA